jgi:hypothetical protein
MVDPDHGAGEGDDERRPPDELERRWPIETVDDGAQVAVSFDVDEPAGVGRGRLAFVLWKVGEVPHAF